MAPRILVVDDDDALRYATEKALRIAGYDVASAADYRGALSLLDHGPPFDLLLTDIVMPFDVNGFTLAHIARIRSLNLKVLYTTGFDIPAGQSGHKILRKPISNEELLEEVRLALAS